MRALLLRPIIANGRAMMSAEIAVEEAPGWP
jgi:hypothetical protein